MKWLLAAFMGYISHFAIASNGLLFDVLATGAPAELQLTICLNGNGPLSCQNYTASGSELIVTPVIPNHTYSSIGVKINTPGYNLTGCTPIANGYCLFSASNTIPKTITANSTSTYIVTASSGPNGTITPSGAVGVKSGDSVVFSGTPDNAYAINLWIIDGVNTRIGGNTYTLSNVTSNHTIQVTFLQTTLVPSVSALGLSVHDTALNTALTGNPRSITIANTGSVDAFNVSVTTSGFPAGTTITSNTCGSTLAAQSTCTITITPGLAASSDSNGVSCSHGSIPVPGVVKVSASNVPNETTVDVRVLSYGCQYQNGLIYSIDDSTSASGSIGGRVAALTNQAGSYPSGSIWSSNGSGRSSTSVSYKFILGIDQTSTTSAPSPSGPPYPAGTPAPAACDGKSDGLCNTSNIISYYNFNRQFGATPTPYPFYAAGLCKTTIASYSDWYLPSICELGYEGQDFTDTGCGTSSAPLIQNIKSNLVDRGVSGSPAGIFWSSTEYADSAHTNAWVQFFNQDSQITFDKVEPAGVRCARTITPAP